MQELWNLRWRVHCHLLPGLVVDIWSRVRKNLLPPPMSAIDSVLIPDLANILAREQMTTLRWREMIMEQ